MATTDNDEVISNADYQVLTTPNTYTLHQAIHVSTSMQSIANNGQFILLYPHLLTACQQVALTQLLNDISSKSGAGIVILGGPQNPPPPK